VGKKEFFFLVLIGATMIAFFPVHAKKKAPLKTRNLNFETGGL
jgi:hypothetical protein